MVKKTTQKSNKTLLQKIMDMFKSKTKKQNKTPKTMPKKSQTKRVNAKAMKGGMIRDGTVVQNMPKRY